MENLEKDPIVIVLAADNNYVMQLATTACSVISNIKSGNQLVIFIIAKGVEASGKNKVLKSLTKTNVRVEWIEPDDAKLSNMLVCDRITIAAYYRILIPEILPTQYKKVIYLDSDLIVQADIEDLWNLDMQDKYVLAVQEMGVPYVSSPGGIKKYQELGIPGDMKFFNSGVLVINLDKWRTDNIAAKSIEYVEKYKQYVRLHDQEALNVVLSDKWGEIDPRWNQQVHTFYHASWKESPLTEEAYNNVINDPYIIHYSSAGKPWKLGCKHPYKHLFFKYLDMTAWAGWRMTFMRKLSLKLKETAPLKMLSSLKF
jgi:lipopolysaccharide biosynthesis glycosyltransferase